MLYSGIGAISGAFIWRRIADRYGRRQVFILTVLNFSIASGLPYFTPEVQGADRGQHAGRRSQEET